MAGLITGIAGAVLSAGTTAASFIQAGNQKRKQQDYEADAAKALADARKKLQVNYAEAMSVNKEPYNQERLAMLSAGAQIAQAASESRRGVSAAAGQILASQQAGQTDISNRQGVDMQNIQNSILEEESRLRDINTNLDMQELAGQQQAAADAKLASQVATQKGIQGISNTVGKLINEDMIGLYGGLGGVKGSSAAGGLTSAPTMTDSSKGTVMPQTNPFSVVSQPQQSIAQVGQDAPQVLTAEAFTSAEEAASLGYVWDSSLGGYVKKIVGNSNLAPEKRIFKADNSAVNYDPFGVNLEGK